MKKLTAIALVAIALVWAAALLDFGTPDTSDEPAPTPEPAAPDDDAPATPQPDAGDAPRQASEPELGDGNRDPDFQRMARLYATEPRDGAWASEEERRLYALVDDAGWTRDAHVHCRKSVCRIDLPGASPEDLAALLRTPGGRATMHLSEHSSYAFEDGALRTYTYRASTTADGTGP